MHTFYFLLTVENASANVVKHLVITRKATDSLAEAAIHAANRGLDVSQIQRINMAQYEAARVPGLHDEIKIRP